MTTTDNFDDELLAFAKTFLGYGNLSSPLWFIGMEEGGGNSKDEIEQRLKAWSKFGRTELCDIANFHNEIGDNSRFSEKSSLQKTWDKLIRFALTLEGKDSSVESARKFQRDSLGRLNSANALLELLPLPSPKSSDWNYSKYSNLVILKDRKTYQNFFLDQRIANIKEKVILYKPKVVIFYGYKKYKNELLKILNIETTQSGELDFLHGRMDGTHLLFTNHPTATGLPSKYYEQIAELVRKSLI